MTPIGPAVLSSDMTSAYVLYFPAAATPPPPPIFPNHTNYQILKTVITLSVLKLAVRNFAWQYICIIPTDHTMQYYTIKYQIIPNISNSNKSVICQGRSLKFCMIVDLDNTNKLYHAIPCHAITYYTTRYQVIPNISKVIIESFFKLGVQNFLL